MYYIFHWFQLLSDGPTAIQHSCLNIYTISQNKLQHYYATRYFSIFVLFFLNNQMFVKMSIQPVHNGRNVVSHDAMYRICPSMFHSEPEIIYNLLLIHYLSRYIVKKKYTLAFKKGSLIQNNI